MKMPPAGAGAERFSVMLSVLDSITSNGFGVNTRFKVTLTSRVSGAKPGAVARICVVPIRTPVTCGFAAGVTCPAAMNTQGSIEAMDGLRLVSVTTRPPPGAGLVMLTGRLTV